MYMPAAITITRLKKPKTRPINPPHHQLQPETALTASNQSVEGPTACILSNLLDAIASLPTPGFDHTVALRMLRLESFADCEQYSVQSGKFPAGRCRAEFE